MSGRDRDEELVSRARAQLDRDVDALDETTRARLRAARLRALDALDAPRAWHGLAAPRRLLLASAAALALVLATTSWLAAWRQRESAARTLADGLDDVEILATADDLELYDDLDFYRWLADEGTL